MVIVCERVIALAIIVIVSYFMTQLVERRRRESTVRFECDRLLIVIVRAPKKYRRPYLAAGARADPT